MLTQHNFRLDKDTDRLLRDMAGRLGMSRTDVVRQAIRALARRKLPNTSEEKIPENSAEHA